MATEYQSILEQDFMIGWEQVQRRAYETAKAKGFHDVGTTAIERLALAHSELSEALEAMRKGNPPSEKIPGVSRSKSVSPVKPFSAISLPSMASMLNGTF